MLRGAAADITNARKGQISAFQALLEYDRKIRRCEDVYSRSRTSFSPEVRENMHKCYAASYAFTNLLNTLRQLIILITTLWIFLVGEVGRAFKRARRVG